jgi:hypothetical protein
MRKSDLFFIFWAVALAFLGLLFVYGGWQVKNDREALEVRRMMAHQLQLTDLCLFTDARYTRHLSQADLNTPFQDHPVALDHFPSGSLVAPPAALTKRHE